MAVIFREEKKNMPNPGCISKLVLILTDYTLQTWAGKNKKSLVHMLTTEIHLKE